MELSDREIIERLGGAAEVARYYKVTDQAVYKWKRFGIPKLRRQLILQNRWKLLK